MLALSYQGASIRTPREIPDIDISVGSLNMSHNLVFSLEDFAPFTKLLDLVLSGNKLTNMDGLPSLKHLRALDISFNRISEIAHLGQLTMLRSLNLSNNLVSSFSGLRQAWSGAHVLAYLDVRNNPGEVHTSSQYASNLVYISGIRPLRHLCFITQSPLSIIQLCPQLDTLNGEAITEQARQSALDLPLQLLDTVSQTHTVVSPPQIVPVPFADPAVASELAASKHEVKKLTASIVSLEDRLEVLMKQQRKDADVTTQRENQLREFLLGIETQISEKDDCILKLEQTVASLRGKLTEHEAASGLILAAEAAKHAEAESQLHALRSRADAIERDASSMITALTSELGSRDDSVSQLTVHVADLRTQLLAREEQALEIGHEQQCTIDNWALRLAATQQQAATDLHAIEQENDRLRDALRVSKAKCEKASQLLQFTLTKQQSKDEEIFQLQRKLTDAEESRSSAELELAGIKSEYADAIRLVEVGMDARFRDYESQVLGLHVQLSNEQRMKADLSAELDSLASRLVDVERLEVSRISEVRNQLMQSHDDEMRQVTRESALLRDRVDDLTAKLEAANNQLDGANVESQNAERSASEYLTSLRIKEGVITDLSEQMSEMKARVKDWDLDKASEILPLQREIESCRNDVRSLTDEVVVLQRQLAEKDETIGYISGEVEGIQRSYAGKLEDAKSQLELEFQAKLDEMKDQLRDAADTLIQLDRQLESTNAENGRLRKDIADLCNEKENDKQSNSDKFAKLSTLIEAMRIQSSH